MNGALDWRMGCKDTLSRGLQLQASGSVNEHFL